MANLTTCHSCKRDVSKFATVCPHCGAPKPATRPLGFMTGFVIVLIVVAVLYFLATRS